LSILFDQTHDNPSYFETENFYNCLPLVGEMSFSNCFIGSVRGFDECFPKKISVFPQNSRIYNTIDEIVPKRIENETELITLRICYEADKKLTDPLEIRGDWDKWTHGVHFK
jgi:hypothetical protein